jgi:hypothetical protein
VLIGDLARKGGIVISDTTFNASYIAGTWTADSGTDVLTCSGLHGLVVNQSISFNPLTGVLPTGIEPEPEYYFVASTPTTSTITISATRGGATLNITANGTTGWGIRQAHVAPTNTTTDFATYSDIEIYSEIPLIQDSTNATSFFVLTILPNTCRIWLNNAASDGASNVISLGITGATSTKKHSMLSAKIVLRKISNNFYHISIQAGGISADTINFASASSFVLNVYGLIKSDNMTGFNLFNTGSSKVKNGTRMVVIGR